mgnify:CR=1 FL=1
MKEGTNMQNDKYIMIGTPTITKELFRKVLRPLNTYGLIDGYRKTYAPIKDMIKED